MSERRLWCWVLISALALGGAACDDSDVAQTPEDVKFDAPTPSTVDGGAPICQEGERQCTADARSVAVCQGGTWVLAAQCAAGQLCRDALCVEEACVPDCQGRRCGSDGCEGVCGQCDPGWTCSEVGACNPPPPRCGDDACSDDESCATCPADCGACCGDGQCAADESCATCPADCDCEGSDVCHAETERCEPCQRQCEGRECGDDGCGGECGQCAAGVPCAFGRCDAGCQPQCDGRDCGGDGCGGSCGGCVGDEVCSAQGTCEPPPTRCGDQACGEGEDCSTCPVDCGPCCGDGACNPGHWESCATCPVDCGCEAPAECNVGNGVCEACAPQCDGRVCGPDGCDGVCGDCGGGEVCSAEGQCEAPPTRCGDDTCDADEDCATCPADCGPCCGNGACAEGQGENCATCPADCGCEEGEECNPIVNACQVTCVPQCAARNCGPNGCGGGCGDCLETQVCEEGVCRDLCVPDCEGRECGGDTCGGSCGECEGAQLCSDGVCEEICQPDCEGKQCGVDGCGGFCGQCEAHETCDEAQRCVAICQPNCADRACGEDGCGGVCGECGEGESCSDAGQCVGGGVFCDCQGDEVCVDGFCRAPEQICSAENPVGVCASGSACLDGECVDQGAGCSPGNPSGVCPLGEICRNGACEPFDGGALCDDDNACTDDLFDHVRNRCVNLPAARACDDGNGCTVDSCVEGVCVGEATPGCVAPPTIDPYVTPTQIGELHLSGTKPAGASIYINGQEAVPEDPGEAWAVDLNLQPGVNAYEIWSADQGQESATVMVEIVYDITAPTVVVSPDGGVFQSGVSVTAATDEPAIVYYTDDGATPDEWSRHFRSVKRFRIFDDTTLRFRARDLAGNWQEEIVEARFEVTSHGNRWGEGPALPEAVTLSGAAVLDGEIYLIGGTDEQATQAGVHVLDAATGDWRLEAPLPSARAHLAAVTLGGQIYAIGGQDQGIPQNLMQRLTPGGAWENLAPMPSTRFGLAAVPLEGQILVFGGKTNGGVVLDTLEIYRGDNTWTNEVAQMPTPRYGHAAVEHMGRVYLVGGEDEAGTPIARVDVYVVAEDRWEQIDDLPTPRSFVSAAKNYNVGEIDGGYTGVVVAGGRIAGGASTTIVEEFIIEDGAWRARTPLDRPTHSAAAVQTAQEAVVDGQQVRVWLLGGLQAEQLSSQSVYFTQDHDYLRRLAELPEGRFMHAAEELDGLIYLFGGRDFQETALFWSFDPELGAYEALPELPSFQNGLGSAVLDGQIYAIGGANNFGASLPTVRSYEPATRTWTERMPMAAARRDPAVVVLDDEIYVIGGYNNGALQSVEIYNPEANRWRAGPLLPEGRSGAGAVVHDGEIIVVGGVNSADAVMADALRFRGGAWEDAQFDIPVAYSHVTLIHDHQLNAFGGRGVDGQLTNEVWSIRLTDRVMTNEIFEPSNLLARLDRAALAYYNGAVYLFGGNTTQEIGPEGARLVQKLDGRCFNGVHDGREDASDDYDRGGACPGGLWIFEGIQHSVHQDELSGWRRCHNDGYENGNTTLANLQSACDGEYVMVGCRRDGSDTWLLLAMALRTDVFHNTGDNNNSLNRANGVDWYYSNSYSMGFVLPGSGVQRSSCDTGSSSASSRMCWHTSGGRLSSGYRCGTNTSLGGGWERGVWTSP